MKFAAKVFAGNLYIGEVSANSLTVLKRLASAKCNSYYKSIDAMMVYRVDDEDIKKEIKFIRINRKAPDNTWSCGYWM